MKLFTILPALAVSALLATGASAGPRHYDNDDQALRVRDMVADPSVPLAWDRRHRPETWRYRFDGYDRDVRHCSRNRYWDGEECVRKRRR